MRLKVKVTEPLKLVLLIFVYDKNYFINPSKTWASGVYVLFTPSYPPSSHTTHIHLFPTLLDADIIEIYLLCVRL